MHSLCSYLLPFSLLFLTAVDDPRKIVKVVASDGKSGETRDLVYTNCKVIGNGSFGIVFQAKLLEDSNPIHDIAIKKVLQDKRFKACTPSSLSTYASNFPFSPTPRTVNCRS